MKNLNYRYLAQQSAQFENYEKAESQLLKYLEQDNLTVIQRHFAYTDLILYTYKQFNQNKKNFDILDKCLNYCLEHIKLIPKLNKEFQKVNFTFDYEFIVSIEIAIILLLRKDDEVELMNYFNELRSYYDDRKNQHEIGELAYQINYEKDTTKYNIENIDDVFTKYFKSIKNNSNNKF